MVLPITWKIEMDYTISGSYQDITSLAKIGAGGSMRVSATEDTASEFALKLRANSAFLNPRFSSGNFSQYIGQEGVPIRLRASHNGITYTLWQGYVNDWNYDIVASGGQAAGNFVSLRCGDILSLKSDDFVTLDPITDDLSTVFAATFAASGIPSGLYDASVIGDWDVTNFERNRASANQVWRDLLAASMGGHMWVPGSNGKATFRPPKSLLGVASPTQWGDGSAIVPKRAIDVRKRGQFLTKVDVKLAKTTITDPADAEVVVYDHGLNPLDPSTALTLAPGQVIGPFRLIPNQTGVQAITGTPLCIPGIDYWSAAGSPSGGLDAVATNNTIVALNPVAGLAFHYDMTIKNISTSSSYYMRKLIVRSQASIDQSGTVSDAQEKTSFTGADVAAAGSVAWSTPTNITANDGTYATASVVATQITHYLTALGGSFSVPSNATITGVLAEVEGKANNASPTNLSCRVIKNGTITTAETRTAIVTNSDAYMQFGGPNELWGLSLTPEQVNSSNFGIALFVDTAANTQTYSIDHVRIIVFYTINSGQSTKTINYVQELDIPRLDMQKGKSLTIPSIENDNLARDFGQSELMKFHYSPEEISLLFDWKNDATIVEMMQLAYGQVKRYTDKSLDTDGLYVDEIYRVVGYTHNITIGKPTETQVWLRPCFQFHNINNTVWDDFNRADSATLDKTPTGDTWSVVSGSFGIVSKKARATTLSALNMVTFDLGKTDMNILVRLEAFGSASADSTGFVYRYFDPNNYWIVWIRSGSLFWGKVVAGVTIFVLNGGGLPASIPMPWEFRIIVQANRHRLWVNRFPVSVEANDSAHNTRTKFGFYDLLGSSGVGSDFSYASAIALN